MAAGESGGDSGGRGEEGSSILSINMLYMGKQNNVRLSKETLTATGEDPGASTYTSEREPRLTIHHHWGRWKLSGEERGQDQVCRSMGELLYW